MKYLLVISFLSFSPLLTFAQEKVNSELFESRKFGVVNISSHLEIAIPYGRFQERIEHNTLWGKGFYFLYRSRHQPIDFGIRIGDLVYDIVRRNIDANTVQKSKNKIWMWYGAFRYEPNINFPILPYFEGSFGTTRFHSKAFSREKGIDIFGEQLINPHFDKIRLNSDWAVGYGAAIGFYWLIGKDDYTSVDFQVGYQNRGIGRFLVREDAGVIQEIPIDNFTERRSKMELVSFKIGISLIGLGVRK